MRAKNINLNCIYHITLGRNEVLGEVVAETENGWEVRLMASDKVIKVNNEERFLRKARTISTINEEAPVTPPAEPVNEQGMSSLNAAHRVLIEIGTPLNVRQIADAVRERGYAPNLNGKTPQATISSSIQREIARKESESRFYKAGKGLYAAVECRQQ